MFIMTKKKDLKHQKPLAYFFAVQTGHQHCGTVLLHLLNVDAGDCYLYIRIFLQNTVLGKEK